MKRGHPALPRTPVTERGHPALPRTPATERGHPALPPELATALLAWYARHRRRLPWRDEPTPYRVVVSELMLQQTQVDTVLPYFARWMARFPDWRALASAPLDDVLAYWSGLGYYARARNLHRLAAAIVTRHGGEIPKDVALLRALPGVGPYTAGAVASIALGQPEPLVDGNVARVLARLALVTESVGQPRGREITWALARQCMMLDAPRVHPGEWNQALMELGALVCRKAAPTCLVCPVRGHCRAHALGLVDEIPPVKARTAVMRVEAVCVRVRIGDSVILARRPEQGEEGRLWGGLWELPGGPLRAGEDPRSAASEAWRRRLGEPIPTMGPVLAEVEHVLTHRRYRLVCVEGTLSPVIGEPQAPLGFYTAQALRPEGSLLGPRSGVSRLTAKVIEACDSPGAQRRRS